jgi:hypothetical protein
MGAALHREVRLRRVQPEEVAMAQHHGSGIRKQIVGGTVGVVPAEQQLIGRNSEKIARASRVRVQRKADRLDAAEQRQREGLVAVDAQIERKRPRPLVHEPREQNRVLVVLAADDVYA